MSGIGLERGVDPGQQVSRLDLAPSPGDRVGEVVPVAGGPAGVGVQHEEARVREDVEGPEEVVAVGAVRPAVDLQDHRVRAPRLVADRLDDPALDLGPVVGPPAQRLGRLQAEGGEPRVVERGHPALAAAVPGVDEDLGGGGGTGHRVGDDDAVAGRRDRPHLPVAARDLSDEVAGLRHLEEMAVAADAGEEPHRVAARGPGGGAGPHVPVAGEVAGDAAQGAVGGDVDHPDVRRLAPPAAVEEGEPPPVGRDGGGGLAAGVGGDFPGLAGVVPDHVDVARRDR